MAGGGELERAAGEWVWGRHASGDGWVVMPVDEARYWADVVDAIASGCWDRVRSVVGEDLWEVWFEDDLESAPAPGSIFEDPDVLPGYGDGTFPARAGVVMLESVPDRCLRCPQTREGLMSAEELVVDDRQLEVILDCLKREGAIVQRDDDLVAGLW